MSRSFAHASLPLIVAGAFAALSASPVAAQENSFDTHVIDVATGIKGTYSDKENVYKITRPRTDIKLVVDGVAMPPFMGLASYAAFTKGRGSSTMVMGDTVLLQDEVNPVMSIALDSGLEVTALHNHFFFDEPRVYFMHIGGEGEAAKLAQAVKRMYDKVAEIRAGAPQSPAGFGGSVPSARNAITAQPLETIFGTKGESNDGMFKVVIGRTGDMHGVNVGKEMGVNTWAAFAGSDDNAVVDGDFAMHENELQPVLKAMRADGINIVAIHQHMSAETPRYLFLHYWGKGKAADLARSVKHALDAQAKAPAGMTH